MSYIMKKRVVGVIVAMTCALSVVYVAAFAPADDKSTAPAYPSDIKAADGKLYVSSKGHDALYIYDEEGAELSAFDLGKPLSGVAVKGDKAYVTAGYGGDGELMLVDLVGGEVQKSVKTGSGACSPVLDGPGRYVYVLNRFSGTVSKIDAATLEPVGEAAVLREPCAAVMSPDGRYLFVNNFLPFQRADVDYVAADVSVIEVASMTKVKDIKLDNGSNALRDICITPDGKYVLVSHNLGRFQVPTSQLQQGWMNTSAVSVIDARKLDFLGSVVVDEPEHGAAGVWGLACDGDKLVVAQSGTHDVSVIDYKRFIDKFEKTADRSRLSYDLQFLYGMRDRVKVEGNGPRRVALSEGMVFVPTYFSDTLNVIDAGSGDVVATAALNPSRMETAAQRGERYFNDAEYCFQNWQSCNGCHPGDARTDGMNWDLMNDGIGNPKNCKSMLYAHVTPPSMISGIRETAELAVRKGFFHIQFYNVPEDHAACVDAYLKSLEAVPSPYLVDGKLSETAKQGRMVFERLRCDECHSGPYFTDLKMHRIGDDIEFDAGWDTPTLREVWRTGPYLFDGRAATLEEVFSVHGHGIDGKVSKKDMAALVEYVKSL